MNCLPSRILFVDDHQDTLDLYALVLSRQNYLVVTATTLNGALEETKTQHFDLLVLDSRLTDGSGLDLCRTIREVDQITPILFCSGQAYQRNKEEAIEAGAQAYLVKPVDMREMCDTIGRLIRMSGTDQGITHRGRGEHLAQTPAAQPSLRKSQ